MKKLLFVCLFSFACAITGLAQNGAQSLEEAQRLAQGLHYQEGEITLPNDLAKLNVSKDFRFLNSEDAQTVLVKIWGNPPSGDKPLGMILPADADPTTMGAWAVV